MSYLKNPIFVRSCSNKSLKQTKHQRLFLTCAPISELPSNMSTPWSLVGITARNCLRRINCKIYIDKYMSRTNNDYYYVNTKCVFKAAICMTKNLPEKLWYYG